MPKSRFNAVREKARASRHNPIQRSRANGVDSERIIETPLGLATSGKAAGEDVLPVLKSLPLPAGKETQKATPEDTLWALNSLTSFLASKSTRNELLQPKHDVVARIVLQLHSDQPIEVRDAASGCLRNICIEAAGRARKGLEAKDCIEACASEWKSVARSLGLLEGGEDVGREKMFEKFPQPSVQEKPKSEMNRKERRQAAKAEAAAAKKSGTAEPKQIAAGVAESMEVEQAPVSADAEDEKINTRYSHLTNIAAVLWCLVEMSPDAVHYCERIAPTICQLIARTVEVGGRANQWLSQNAVEKESNDTKKINVGRKDQRVIEQGRVDAAIMCLNALVTLSDSNPSICAAFVGISRQELLSASKGKGKKVILEDEESIESNRAGGQQNIQSLRNAVHMLAQEPRFVGAQSDSVARTISSLGLLSLAVIRNIQSSLPSLLKSGAGIVGEADSTLSYLEGTQGVACLQKVIKSAADAGVQLICKSARGSIPDEQSSFLSSERYAQDDVNNLNLALEVLAELVSDRDEAAWSRDTEAEDDAMDDGGDDQIGDSGDDEEMIGSEHADGEERSDVPTQFGKTHVVRLIEPSFADSICRLAFSSTCDDLLSGEESGASPASALRGVIVRALSVLNNSTLALASYAQPPPSQPVTSDEQDERIKHFQSWLIQSDREQILATVWRWTFELASGLAASPLVSAPTSTTNGDHAAEDSSSAEATRIVEICLGVMWNVARCFEGMPEMNTRRVLVVNAGDFESDVHCATAKGGAGVVASLVAAYRGSKRGDGTKATQVGGVTDIAASGATGSDGFRVACLGVLSTLVRNAHVWPEHLSVIATLLADCLEAMAPRSSSTSGQTQLALLNVSDWTSMDGMIVAVNGVIDTFADETKPWDGHYAALGMHKRLRKAEPDVRSAARTIDRRKQAGLRLSADEAWENLNGFIQYRGSL